MTEKSVFEAPHDLMVAYVLSDWGKAANILAGIGLHYPSIEAEIYPLYTIDQPELRGISCVCLGHLGRRFGTLSETAIQALKKVAESDSDPEVRGQAEDALEDLEHAQKLAKGEEG